MLKRRCGLTLDQYETMLLAQDNLCAGCKRPLVLIGTRPPVDHDHATGRVRGILHKGCNLALAETGEDPVTLRLLAEYIEKHQHRHQH